MSTIIGIEGYPVKGRHGVFDWEREKEQLFRISIWVRLERISVADELETSVDYGFLQRVAHDVIKGDPIRMMETVCDRIIEVVAGHLNVAAVKVRIEKPEAPLPHNGGLAVVERTSPEGEAFLH